jgi:hypothetical protein
LIPETFINGLSSVFDNNFESYDLPYGGIYKLHYENQSLKMFQELKVGSILVEQVTFNDFTGQNVVGASPDILSKQVIYYAADLGIGQHPESFGRYEQAKYGIDVKRGAVYRLSTDGLTPISKYFQHTFFTNLCKKIMMCPDKVNIYGVFDIRFGEYIISVSSFTYDRVVEPAHTIAFNEKANQWSTHYSYAPENMVGSGVDVITFKNGQLWKHNTNAIYNNFYGTQYASEVWVYCNLSPSNIKAFEAISLEGVKPWDVVIETPVTNDNPTGQHTELIVGNFQMKEGFWYSDILKDDNTPNVTFPRFEGNPMRGAYALVKLTYTDTTYTKLFAVNVLAIGSDRSNK